MTTPKKQIPKHWKESTWDEKARENPLYAIMTTPEMADADVSDFSKEHLDKLFAKGRKLFNQHISGLIDITEFNKDNCFLVEFGCGAGRILNAAVENGFTCAGIDISPIMLEHCRKLVPGIRSLHKSDAVTCQTDLESEVATHVYSYAVVQHISSLKVFQSSIFEMIRILKPGGILALQVNCEDFTHNGFDQPGRTENFETHSLHYKPGEKKPYRKHLQNYWSGVYIGYSQLKDQLAEANTDIINKYYHNPQKKRAIWVIGKKHLPS